MVASISGVSSRLLKSAKGLHILFLFFTIQYQVLWLGIWISGALQPFTQHVNNWLSITILGTIGFKMIYELMKKQRESPIVNLGTKAILNHALSTCIYTFLLGSICAWLKIDQLKLAREILLFIVIFMLAGFYISKYKHDKILLALHIGSICLIFIGTVLVAFEKLK